MAAHGLRAACRRPLAISPGRPCMRHGCSCNIRTPAQSSASPHLCRRICSSSTPSSTSMPLPADWIAPDWPAPARVKAFVTTRNGGVSTGPYASLNLGTRVGDDIDAVSENRTRVRAYVPGEPRWLHQVHGTRVAHVEEVAGEVAADAAYTRASNVVCAIQIADCLPVLFCDRDGACAA